MANTPGPAVGSIIRLGKGRTDLVVIESEQVQSPAPVCDYYGWQFKTIRESDLGHTINPRETEWTMDDWGMGGDNMVAPAAIQVQGTVRFKKDVQVRYVYS